MKVWHIGPYKLSTKANGVAVVTKILVDTLLENGVDAKFYKSTYKVLLRLVFLKNEMKPDLIHFHSCKRLILVVLASVCRLKKIKYFVHPHGGYYPNLMLKDNVLIKMLKQIYISSFEKIYIGNAEKVVATQDEEAKILSKYFSVQDSKLRVLPNPARVVPMVKPIERNHLRIAYIGRFDIHHKGIDRIVELARLLPEYRFELYGAANIEEINKLSEILNIPHNTYLNQGVYGEKKYNLLLGIGFFIQLSRFEACATASVEALAFGTPVLLSEDMAMAKYVAGAGRGVVLDSDLNIAAQQIRNTDIVGNMTFYSLANQWIEEELSPNVIVKKLIDIYRE